MLRQAYKDSCKTAGVQFNRNENYINPSAGNIYDQILTEYGDSVIYSDAVNVLRKYGILTDEYLKSRNLRAYDKGVIGIYKPEDVADIIMRFIAISMPKNFTYKYCESHPEPLVSYPEPLNGWWNEELNCQFGYGIYN